MTAAPPAPAAAPPRPHRFTVEEYLAVHEAAALGPVHKTELIRGEILDMSPVSPPHAAAVNILDDYLRGRLGQRAWVSVEKPVTLPTTASVPNPDLAVCARRPDRYAFAHPRPADVLLLIEVALSSLGYDRTTKRDLYAEAEIIEYWIVNLVDRQLERYLLGEGGAYGEAEVYAEGEALSHAVLGEVAVGDLLPMAMPEGGGSNGE